MYAAQTKKITTVQALNYKPDIPGPGSYNNLFSDFNSHKRSGTKFNPTTSLKQVSPGRAAALAKNPTLKNMSVPSIPSRYMTPIIDGV